MTDKDSQLDEIERLANNLQDDVGSEQWLNGAAEFKRKLGINMFAPGGLYYEMRRELEMVQGKCRGLERIDRERAMECMALRRENKQARKAVAEIESNYGTWAEKDD